MSRPTTCAGCRRGRLFTTGRPSDGTDERMPAGEAGTGRRGWKGPLGPLDDDECQALAEEIERQRPGWSVLWGVYSKRLTAFPPLSVPDGTILVVFYPDALVARMDEAERAARGHADGAEAGGDSDCSR